MLLKKLVMKQTNKKYKYKYAFNKLIWFSYLFICNICRIILYFNIDGNNINNFRDIIYNFCNNIVYMNNLINFINTLILLIF